MHHNVYFGAYKTGGRGDKTPKIPFVRPVTKIFHEKSSVPKNTYKNSQLVDKLTIFICVHLPDTQREIKILKNKTYGNIITYVGEENKE